MSDEAPVEVVEVDGAKPETVDEPLGEGGLKALKAERERAAAAEKLAAEQAARLKEFEDAQKTADELAAERQAEAERKAVEAERRAAEVELRAVRAEVAAATSVPVDILSGPKSGSAEDIQAFADALTQWRGEAPKRSAAPLIEGTSQVTPEVDLDAAIAAAQKAGNFPLAITLKSQKAAAQN